ncbi:MAG: rane protein [Proteobacteria bacterium]|nr:rane protein [Pseudomonadota bacterium]
MNEAEQQMAVPDQPDPVAQLPVHRLDFHFHGQGGEYFRIWIVNLALSIITLSIYSAWAKVRALRYFYGNTELAGSRFDFHGRPTAILIGRLVMLTFVVAYVALSNVAPLAALGLMLVLVLASPWLVWRSMKFRLGNTSYRNIRLGFTGSLGGAYKYLLLTPLLTIVSFGLAFPFVQQRMARYLISNVRYGDARLSTQVSVGEFYIVYLAMLGVLMGGGMVTGIVVALGGAAVVASIHTGLPAGRELLPALFVAGAIVYLLVLAAYFLVARVGMSMLQQMIWNKADLAGHRFESRIRVWPAVRFHLVNIGLLIATLGLAWAWVKVRGARFRLENLSLHASGGLTGISAVAAAPGGAVGEEMAEMFDFDFAL